MGYGYQYTSEQSEYLKSVVKGRSYADVTAMFNERFGLNMSQKQIGAALKNRGLRNGRDMRIKPGAVPHNKGKARWWVGGEQTRFKPGNTPATYRPVGSERFTRDGYAEIKVADPKTWKRKHVVVWEAAYGPVPKGHAVIFGDGDNSNITLDNLLLVTRGELAVMNKLGLIQSHIDLTKAGKLIADIVMAARKRAAP